MRNGARVISILMGLLLFWVPAAATATHGVPWGYCAGDTPVITHAPPGPYGATCYEGGLTFTVTSRPAPYQPPTALAESPFTWRWRNPQWGGEDLPAIAFGNWRFVAAGGGGYVWISEDGVTWKKVSIGTSRGINGVYFAGGEFVLASGHSILTSANGEEWNQWLWRDAKDRQYYVDFQTMKFMNGNGRVIGVSAGFSAVRRPDGTWTVQEDDGPSDFLHAAFFDGHQFVRVYANRVSKSADGETWVDRANPFMMTPEGDLFAIRGRLLFNNGRFVRVYGNTIETSPDGTTWLRGQVAGSNTPLNPTALVYQSGRHVIVTASDRILTSTDGQSWTVTPTEIALADVSFGNGTFVAVGSTATILTSVDGSTWKERNPGLHAFGDLFSVIFSGEQWFAFGEGRVLVSKDTMQWRVLNAHLPAGISQVVFGKGLFAAIDGARVYTSTDAVTWTERTSVSDWRYSLKAIAYSDGHFIAGGHVLLTSADGVTWQEAKAPWWQQNVTAIAFGAGVLVATTDDAQGHGVGNHLYWSVDGGASWGSTRLTTKSFVTHDGSRFIVSAPAARKALVMEHGQAWQEINVEPAPGIEMPDDGLGGGIFASADAEDVIKGPDGWIGVTRGLHFTSPDGLTWRQHALPDVRFRAVAYGNHQFVAVGENGAIVGTDPHYPAALRCGGFTDLHKDNPACAGVRELVALQAINGYPDGTYRPWGSVTRAEWAKLLAVTMRWNAAQGSGSRFTDTKGHWADHQGYLQAVVQHGAMNGFPNGSFQPNAPVNRAQLVKTVASAAGLSPESGLPYIDLSAGDWFAGWVAAAHRAHLVGPGAENRLWTEARFDGELPVTRAEAAMILANLLH